MSNRNRWILLCIAFVMAFGLVATDRYEPLTWAFWVVLPISALLLDGYRRSRH
jgi:hypothetical protein